MYKEVTFGEDMKEKVASGVKKIADAVASTLGPSGRTVIIQSPLEGGTPTITKDGVTVAKSIKLEDPVEEIGASLVKNIAGRTNLIAGDGTSTSTVLAGALVEEGLKQINKGLNPINIKRGFNQAVDDTINILKKSAKDIKSKEEISQVATISANDDKDIGNLIAEAMENIGRDGVITVADSKTTETNINYVEGMQFERGYISSYFCNDSENLMVDYKDPFILIYKGVILRSKELIPILDAITRQGKQLFIIANDITGDALTLLAYNSLQGTIQACAVKSPGFGDMQSEMLQDIAILTGATVVDPDSGMKLESITDSFLGRAESIKVSYDSTTIVNGAGDPTLIEDRVNKLRNEILKSSGYEKEKLQERLAKLSGGVAVLNIGATTEVELKEKKHRVEDALNATRSAVSEGIIPGGGSTLAKISQSLKPSRKLNKEELVGFNIVKKALAKPFIQIILNAGLDDLDIISEDSMKLHFKGNRGYDVLNRKWVDMYKAGIVDPVKVTRTALENAASVASLVLTSSCVITNGQDNSPS